MLFRITTTNGDDTKELSKYIPIFGLSRLVAWRGVHPNRREDACWTINIKDLEELVEFSKKEQLIITSKCAWNDTEGNPLPEIEIYNDYRE